MIGKGMKFRFDQKRKIKQKLGYMVGTDLENCAWQTTIITDVNGRSFNDSSLYTSNSTGKMCETYMILKCLQIGFRSMRPLTLDISTEYGGHIYL